MGMRWIKSKFIFAGLLFGAAVAFSVTLVICVWEWIENPGGIFRGDDGTNWGVVFDTAISWLIPTFFYAVLVAWLVQLFHKGASFAYRKYFKSNGTQEDA